MFGMKENNELVDLYMVLCYMASSADHAWEFIMSAVHSSYQRHVSFVPI
jgi:hypothetical protein